jgi:tetratricopeptide (TPR) repeat protein
MPVRGKSPLGAGIVPASLLLFAAAVLVYLPALRNGFVWDDDMLLTRNRMLRSVSGLGQIWFSGHQADYWPVTYSALWVQWRLWGLHPLGYHAVNLVLHAANTLLLWSVLRRIGLPGSFLAALVFAVHPLNVESVAWISEIKNLLALLFTLASVWSYLGSGAGDRESVRHWRSYWLSLLLFTLAMLSKGSVCMLPFVLLGLVAWHRRVRNRDVALLAPFFVAAIALASTAVWFQTHGTGQVFRNAGPLDRLLGAGAALWFYLGKAVWPANLTFVYPEWSISARNPAWWVPLLAAAGLTAVLWRRRCEGARPVLFAWGYFCAALVPALGFTDVYFMRYSLVADRYAQLALIGVIAFAVHCRALWEASGRGSAFARLLPFAAVAALGVLTWSQCAMYRDARTLFLATIERNPRCWMAYDYLGSTCSPAELSRSIAYFEEALAIKPDYAEARDNLGVALGKAGRLAEARAQFDEVLRQDPFNPQARANLEWLRGLQGGE